MALRPFAETDYPAFTELYNRLRPEVAQSQTALRAFDTTFRENLLLNLVAETGGELVGAVWAHKDAAGERQVRFDMVTDALETLPQTLYETALTALEPYRPTALLIRVREEWTFWLDFYEERGFGELERMWESRLELGTFSPERFAGTAERPADITFKTLAELPDDEATQRLLYTVVVELLGDVPFHEPLNIWPFPVWQERFWRNPTRCPKGFFLAFHGPELGGVS